MRSNQTPPGTLGAYPPSYGHLTPSPQHHHSLLPQQNQYGGPQDFSAPQYADPSRSPDPSFNYRPEPRAPLYTDPPASHGLSRDRSASESSLHPALPKTERNAQGGTGKEGEYPVGWSKEDEEAEKEFIKAGMFDWNAMRRWQFWIRKEWWYWYLGAVVLGVLVALMAIYHDDIVDWLKPVANWMKELPAGWTIPIAVMFVLSFPPLFGHEIVAILCGVVWGLWVGAGIVAAGTFLGEVGNFYAFKYCLRSRAEKLERDNLNYAIMAHVVRDGGFFFIFAVRLSAIPGHFSTAVFATCGMNIFIFSLATILTMPKQLIVVYLGVLFNEQEKSTKSKIISYTVLVVGFLITVWSAWYCYRQMNKVRVIVWRKQRIALAGKGVSIDPVTGQPRRGESKDWSAIVNAAHDEEADLRSPILAKDTRQTPMQQDPYAQNPYGMSYRPSENLSTYELDGPEQRIPKERDGYGYHPAGVDSVESFPQAWPSGQSGLHRQATTASAFTAHDQPAPSPAVFPTPSPARPAQSGAGGYAGQDQYRPSHQQQGYGDLR